MPSNPYQSLPPSAYWRSAVAKQDALEMRGLWRSKFDISKDMRIVTAGSCFAQHISRAFQRRGYNWYNAEPAPGSSKLQQAYHYGTFSFRTGNIYTTRMLNQWMRWSGNPETCPDVFWQKGGRYYDPFRPMVEPEGFETLAEARASRMATLHAIDDASRRADVFIFTLGLTECWMDAETDVEFAVCPGTIAGRFDAKKHVFQNMNYSDVMRNLSRAISQLKSRNNDIKVLLTVSPVPLTATASDQHVLTATTYSKSVLRAVAGMLAESNDIVDYFPSYEIITHPAYQGRWYAPNKRSVRPEGVDHVMRCFFHDLDISHGRTPSDAPPIAAPAPRQTQNDDVRCEEEMLDAFNQSRAKT